MKTQNDMLGRMFKLLFSVPLKVKDDLFCKAKKITITGILTLLLELLKWTLKQTFIVYYY